MLACGLLFAVSQSGHGTTADDDRVQYGTFFFSVDKDSAKHEQSNTRFIGLSSGILV